MKIFAISDIHSAVKPFEKVSELIKNSDLVTISGDLSGWGSLDECINVLNTLSKINSNIIAVHGNMDSDKIIQYLDEKQISIHSRGIIRDSIGFFGVGGSNITPMNTPTEYSEDEIDKFLHDGYKMVKNADKIVLISHSPPRGANDKLFFGKRVGSVCIKNFLENNRVDICLAGHIHEAVGCEYIKNTPVVNPGSFKKGKYAIISIKDIVEISLGKL
jgi:Icc-related predicted phosphoesterase